MRALSGRLIGGFGDAGLKGKQHKPEPIVTQLSANCKAKNTISFFNQSIGYSLNAYAEDLKKYGTATGEDARKLRDKMVYGLMGEIDYDYYDYQSRLFVDRGAFGVGKDFVQMGLSSAATITGGAHTKAILAAFLSGVTGASLSVDKNFFQQQTVEAILSSMNAARDQQKTTIAQTQGQALNDMQMRRAANVRAPNSGGGAQ